MRWVARFLVALSASAALVAQSPAPAPAFDAADVHIRTRSSNANPFMTGGVLRGGRYDLRNATMVDLIVTAYGVNAEAVLGGPNWLERDRFDIVAKAPQTTTPEALKQMLQQLLKERFALSLRNDNRALPGFALTVPGGTHKMKQSATPGTSASCAPVGQPPPPGTGAPQAIACVGMTSAAMAQFLRPLGGGYLDAPVTDETKLEGAWDFELRFTSRALLAQAGSDGITLFDALEKQLGLKLERRPILQPVIVVESVNQRPIANPSGAAQNVPLPPPAEFDVADIKLSEPGNTAPPMGRFQPGGRLNLQNFPLRGLMNLAWDINDNELLAAPSWIDEIKVSVVARASNAAVGAGDPNGIQLDIDDVRLMFQALLKERFKIVMHTEERPVTAYELLVDRPKLTKADPANRTSCKNGAAPNARDPRNSNPILSRLVTCVNITMAQFAEEIPRLAPGYVRTPVTDKTGLEGNWDFTLNFTPAGIGQAGPPRGADGGGAGGPGGAPAGFGASDPTGAISLFDAIKGQLGLKLEMQKRPLPVIVIDSMERKPIDN